MEALAELRTALAGVGARCQLLWKQFEATELRGEQTRELDAADSALDQVGAAWQVGASVEAIAGQPGSFRVCLRWAVRQGQARQVGVGVRLAFEGWSTRNYVLMPAAVYAGNRFRMIDRKTGYAAMHGSPEHAACLNGLETPITVSAGVPHLANAPGLSRIQQRVGDLAMPAVALHFAGAGRGLLAHTTQQNGLGLYGFFIQESDDRSRAWVDIFAPCVRQTLWSTGQPRDDRGADLNAGDNVEMLLHLHLFPATTVADLFAGVFDRRHELRVARQRHDIPFSSVWATQQDKYNRQNWVEEYGYYSVGMRESSPQDWQVTWVGGLNTVYALLAEGDATTQARARRTFDFQFCEAGVFPSGFLRSRFHKGEWGDGPALLARYNGDALYFLAREYDLLERRDGVRLKPRWVEVMRGIADAFVRQWDTFGQFGGWVRGEDASIIWGGTTSASLAVAGLALASQRFHQPRYLAVAEAAAALFCERYLRQGISNNGPGDALQAVDSESAAGLLESCMVLHEVTGDPKWIACARVAAHFCATWTMTYDFVFPPSSTFGKLDMLTTGTVFANIQNKHSAPGLCTLSGSAFLRLFRATGDVRYLDLIRDIAHAIPQFMSRADRPIRDRRPNQRWPVLDPGWINERVNTSDWEVRGQPDQEIGVGEVFGGSTWSEPAMMLTYADLPGVYVVPDAGLVRAIDHVDARLVDADPARCVIEITNPTRFPARVKVIAETTQQMRRPWDPLWSLTCPRVDVAPGATTRYPIP